MASVVTAERFASGMTFDEYLTYIASPENLARESSSPAPRRDFSADLRAAFEQRRLTADQTEALRWLVAQPGGPAKLLVVSEEWSSDCRRDIPTLARIAEAGGLELRIFRRDGQRFSDSQSPSLAEAPDSNADIMSEFLNHKRGETYQSIPLAVFYDQDLNYLYHYQEFPAIYDKDRLVLQQIREPRAGETPEQTTERGNREMAALLATPFFRIWTVAAVDEILSALHRRLVLGEA